MKTIESILAIILIITIYIFLYIKLEKYFFRLGKLIFRLVTFNKYPLEKLSEKTYNDLPYLGFAFILIIIFLIFVLVNNSFI